MPAANAEAWPIDQPIANTAMSLPSAFPGDPATG
jgi:hypothetical protein